MAASNLSFIADQIRKQGYEARNLGQEGIVIWHDGKGHYYHHDRAAELSALLARNGLEQALRDQTK